MSKSFQTLQTVETWLSDFHKMCFMYRNYILFNIKATTKFQNIFFQFSFSRENFSFEELLTSLFEKTIDVTLKKIPF